jgi:3-oxoacyl-[acyl-carrier-protein] synthase III
LGSYKHALIVPSDIATVALDWAEPANVGDGAAPAVIRKRTSAEASAILASCVATNTDGAEHCHIKAGNSCTRAAWAPA